MAAYTPELRSPSDPRYQLERAERVSTLLRMRPEELMQKFVHTAQGERPRDESGDLHRGLISELFDGRLTRAFAPALQKAILDSTGGGTSGGSVFIRQDLEPIVHSLFVQRFPWYEMIPKGESNGLSHVAVQETATDTNALGATIITETGAIPYSAGTTAKQTYPVAIFGTGRGVTFKELAAVKAGGAALQPLEIELRNGMTALARDLQYTMFAGNATNAAGTATNEQGAYNANAFDGLRGVIGSQGTFSGNNAVQVDQGALNLLDSIKACGARVSNNGGNPTIALMSKLAKDALDQEQGANKRYTDNTVEAVAGMRFNSIATADNDLTVISVPGNTIGTYNRASDNALVEDLYVLDMDHLMLRWLYSENFTVLEIPSGVDGILSSRYLIFGMYTLEQAAPVFSGKVRRISA